jgi:hypothetical protein
LTHKGCTLARIGCLLLFGLYRPCHKSVTYVSRPPSNSDWEPHAVWCPGLSAICSSSLRVPVIRFSTSAHLRRALLRLSRTILRLQKGRLLLNPRIVLTDDAETSDVSPAVIQTRSISHSLGHSGHGNLCHLVILDLVTTFDVCVPMRLLRADSACASLVQGRCGRCSPGLSPPLRPSSTVCTPGGEWRASRWTSPSQDRASCIPTTGSQAQLLRASQFSRGLHRSKEK